MGTADFDPRGFRLVISCAFLVYIASAFLAVVQPQSVGKGHLVPVADFARLADAAPGEFRFVTIERFGEAEQSPDAFEGHFAVAFFSGHARNPLGPRGLIIFWRVEAPFSAFFAGP